MKSIDTTQTYCLKNNFAAPLGCVGGYTVLIRMYTVVGLGNPGPQYEKNRHNAGRLVVEKLAEEASAELKAKKKPDHLVGKGDLSGTSLRFVLPDTFMNKSGAALLPYIKSVRAAKTLIVVYDDIDLSFGKVRVSFGSSAGGHNGVKSVERSLKTRDFIKVRIGISKSARGRAKKPLGEKAVLEFLLGNFTPKELSALRGEVYTRVRDALSAVAENNDVIFGMNRVNGLPPVSP